MRIREGSELADMGNMPNERLKLLYHGSKMMLEEGKGNYKTKFIHDRCHAEINRRAQDASVKMSEILD